MATRRDDRAARIAASFSSDPFFDENAPPPGGRASTMSFAPQPRYGGDELIDEGDLLEDAEPYDDESTRVHQNAYEEGVLDADDMGTGFGDEERTMIWQGGDVAPEDDWPVPSPAPIVYAAKPARATAQAPAVAPQPARNTRRSEPVGQALHYGAPGVAEVAPRRVLQHQNSGGIIVAEPTYAPQPEVQPARPMRQTAAAAPVAAPTAPPAEQRGMPPLQVMLIVLLAVLATAVIALALRLAQTPEQPTAATQAAATIALFTTPAGATVKLDGVAHTAPTPTILTGLEIGRAYAVSVEMNGYETINATIVPDSTQAIQREFTLTPVTGTLVVSSVPPSALVTFDGTVRGPAPQTITGLDLSRTYTVSATLDGHTPATQAVRWQAGAPPQQSIELGLAPLPAAPPVVDPAAAAAAAAAAAVPAQAAAAPAPATAAPAVAAPAAAPRAATTTESSSRSSSTATREPSRTERTSAPAPATTTTTARPSERPSQRPSATTTTAPATSSSAGASASGGGTISVQAVPFGQVWINNRVVANETPLLNHELPVGVHQVKVYFSGLRTFSDERSIRIEPGSSRTLTFRAPPQP
jgi:hypothetical protein